MKLITRIALELQEKGKLTPCQLMYEVMNQVTDKDLYTWDTDLVDIAEKIEYLFATEYNGK